MTNLVDIQNQIQALQKQAEEIQAKEFSSTVQEICAKMQAFGISIKDLQQALGKSGRRTGPSHQRSAGGAGAPRGSVAPKYRGPNGETWSGRGLAPRWMADLIAKGRSKEEFAIKG